MKIRLFILLALLANYASAQTAFNELFHYSFDACQESDALGNFANASFDNVTCECGIVNQSILFDGTSSATLPTEINALFNDDFSMSFFLRINNTGVDPVIIASLGKDNRIDSSLTLRYFPTEELLAFQIAESINSFTEISGDIDINQCWNHIVFAKRDRDYFLYINGELKEIQPSFKALNFFPDAPLVLGNTQNSFTEPNLIGRIDEFRWFGTFLGEQDIASFAQRPNEILTADTTIFLGDILPVLAGPSCATTVNWSPTAGVDDPGILEPTLSPLLSTVYQITMQEADCIVSDSLRVNVIDPDQLDCENLLLPNAFTPNNDGLNDAYRISNEFIIDELEFFDIFDRWGAKMFSASSKVDSWDGSFNNQAVNAGNYVYKISYTCRGTEYAKAGNFTVIR